MNFRSFISSLSFHSWVDGERQNETVGTKELDKRTTAFVRLRRRAFTGPMIYLQWELEADLVPLHLEVI